ncbi:MAG: type I secretion system permease/ATPase [Alphaproteobacteria bacterium]|nr:type I secretion system permease/ATPase [Alphaproteobacteria bacterium]
MNRFRPIAPRETEIKLALKACTGSFLIIAGFSLCINLLTLVSPLYMMQLFDRVLSSRSGDTLIMLTIIVGGALAVLSLIDGIRSQILSRIGTWLDERMGPIVLGGALQTALRSDNVRAAQGMRDLATIRGFLTGPAITPLMDAPWAPLFLLALFTLHPVLGFVGLGGGVLLFGLAILNEVLTKAPLHRASAAATRTHHRTEAALRNAEVIRAMGMLDGVIRLWRRDSAAASAAQIQAGNRGAMILAASKFLRLTVQTFIMGVGAWLVIEHDVSPGTMFASSFLLGRALAPVENAIGTWRSLVGARIAYRRLGDMLGTTETQEKGMELPRPEGELQVERVTYVPPGADAPTLRGISFSLEPGEVLGIIGPSAAGKSTLARLIAGTWTPTAGTVRLDGADINVWLDSGGSHHLGYLPQDIELFSGTVRENIGRLGETDPEDVIEAARLAGLHETIMRLPRGYDSEIGDGGLRLSGGQRQRIGLARALFGKPRLVVLDEPNASLDYDGEEALMHAIAHLKVLGTTVVVIAHRPSILGLADKLLVLRNGAIDVFGERGEVIAKLNGAATIRPGRGGAVVPQKQSA